MPGAILTSLLPKSLLGKTQTTIEPALSTSSSESDTEYNNKTKHTVNKHPQHKVKIDTEKSVDQRVRLDEKINNNLYDNDSSSSSSTTSDNPNTLRNSSASFKSHSSPNLSHDIHSPQLKRLSGGLRPNLITDTSRLDTSVIFHDTQREGRPSIYLFIFVNPLSGDRKGEDLIKLPIQHFRLRHFPHVQVEIHNILDEKDRELGIENIQLVETMAKMNQLPSLTYNDPEHDSTVTGNSDSSKLSDAVNIRHIHVWSAGGDGTVMSVFEMLVEHKIDLDYLFFSCIPFGTGNDFSQVLGWGRTIPHKDILGKRLNHLEELITERLQKSDAARLDIWQVEMEAYPGGFVRLAGPQRKDGHDVLEIDERNQRGTYPHMVRKMCNYMSIGVQGYVGSGFEKHRAGNRLANMLVYTTESAKWVFWRKFPHVTSFIEKIVYKGETVLVCPDPDDKKARKSKDADNVDTNNIPILTKRPIDFVIQNIPHIWGREVDLWGDAKSGLESVKNRSGQTDSENWSPQLANDGKMEIMTIEDMFSYLKKLANIRRHVSRVGQFETPFEIQFRAPPKTEIPNRWWHPFVGNKYKRNNVICIMCDGEFYILKDPKSLKFKRYAQIWTLGKHDDLVEGRLVRDEIVSQKRQSQNLQVTLEA